MRRAWAFAAIVASLLGGYACLGSDAETISSKPDGAAVSDASAAETSNPVILEDEPDVGPPKVVFVTTGQWTGALGGLAGADEKCRAEATDAGLAGTFRAWLSVGDTSPASWAGWTGGYRRVDGELVVGSRKELVTMKKLRAPIGKEEQRVRTNTDPEGKLARPNEDCQGFTQTVPTDGAQSSAFGFANAMDSTWTLVPELGLGCSQLAALYCFETSE